MTGPGPVIDNIIQTTGMSYQSISLLTLLPMLLMVGALVVPMLNQRIGERAGISSAMLLLLVGSLARYFVVDGAALLLTAFMWSGCGLYPVGISWAHQSEFPKNGDDDRIIFSH